MGIAVECPSCAQKFTVSQALAGRRATCSVCHAVVAIPSETGEAGPARNLQEAAHRFSLRDWEVEYAKVLLALGADESAIAAAVECANRPGLPSPPSLPDLLVSRGVVSSELSQRAKTALKPQARDLAKVQATPGTSECPTCLQLVNSSWRSCPYCGARLSSEPELLAQCPNCKADQPHGSRFCSECGAHIDRRMHQSAAGRVCPKCGFVGFGTGNRCYRCGTRFRDAWAHRTPADWAAYVAQTLQMLRVPVAVALLLLAGTWAWGRLSTMPSRDPKAVVSTVLRGEAETALRERLGQWRDAVSYGDWEKMAGIIDPGARVKAADVPARMPAIAGLDPSSQRVSEIRADKLEMSGNEATVYADITVRDSSPKQGQGGILGIGAGKRTVKLTWKWKQSRSGDWRYAGPL